MQCHGLSREGSLLAIAFDDGNLEIRLTSTGELLSAGSSGAPEGFLWLGFSQDGKYLLGELKDSEHSGTIKLYRPHIGPTTGLLESIPITTDLTPLINIYFDGVLWSSLSGPDSLSPVIGSTPSFSHPLEVELPYERESYLQASQLHDAADQYENPYYYTISDLLTASAHLVGTMSSSVSFQNPPSVLNNGEALFVLPHLHHYGRHVYHEYTGRLIHKAFLPAAGGVLVFGGRSDNQKHHLDITIVNFRSLQSVRDVCYSRRVVSLCLTFIAGSRQTEPRIRVLVAPNQSCVGILYH